MHNLATVATQVGVLFALMAVGALCRRIRLLDEASVKGIVNVLILAVTPCLIIDVFQRPFDPAMLRSFGEAFVIVVAAHAALILLARLTARGDGRALPVLRLATVFSNAGFMGVPLEYAILGPEGVFYGIVYVAAFNLFIWSWGLVEMRGSGRMDWASVRPMLVNPGTVGIAVGLPLFLLSVSLPQCPTSLRYTTLPSILTSSRSPPSAWSPTRSSSPRLAGPHDVACARDSGVRSRRGDGVDVRLEVRARRRPFRRTRQRHDSPQHRHDAPRHRPRHVRAVAHDF